MEILWIGADGEPPADVPARVEPREALDEPADHLDEVSAIAVGPSVSRPFELVRRLRRTDALISIVVVTEPDHLEQRQADLDHDPFVGPHTTLVSTHAELEQVLSEAVESTRNRRHHRATVDSVQEAITEDAASTGSPSTAQFAEAMWEHSPVAAIAVVRDSRHVVSANPAAAALLDSDEIDLIGHRLDEIITDSASLDGSLLARLDLAADERLVSHRTDDGEVVHLQIRSTALDSTARDLWLVFLWDVTDRVRLEARQAATLDDERRARQQAERASQIREEVLAAVSHDLRNPLQQLFLSSQMLDRYVDDDPKLSDIADEIERTAEFMDQLVEDLLDVARIEGKGLSLDLQATSLDDLIDRAIELTGAAAAEHGVRLVRDRVPSTFTIVCDPTRVVQMLQNLLDNAIKHSPEGEAVDVEVDSLDEVVCLSVRDRGPGIASEQREAMFENFWQASRRDETGLGLGLAIVAGIVDAHGGDITVDSIVGEGTRFIVELPRQQ